MSTEAQSSPEETIRTCCDCRRQSRWGAAFGIVYSFRGPQPLCPHCQLRRRERSSRRTWTAALILLTAVPLLALLGYARDSLWVAMAGAWLVISMYLSIFPHELGHALMAQAVGYKPLAIIWGEARAQRKREIFGIRLLVGAVPRSGLTFFEPTEARWARLRHLAITAAGPAANLLLGWGVLQLALIIDTPFQESFTKSALLVFAAANGVLCLGNLWPAQVVTPMGRFPNDGLKLIKMMMGSPLPLHESRISACRLRIYFAHADGEAEKLLEQADLAERLAGHAAWIDVARSAAYCRLDRLSEARALLGRLLDSSGLDPGVRALAENNLAWALFALDDPAHDAEALERSARAMDTLPWMPAAMVTRASVLALRAPPRSERASEARGLLDSVTSMDLDAHSLSAVAVARGLLAAGEGDFAAARMQLETARSGCDPGMAARMLEVRLPNP